MLSKKDLLNIVCTEACEASMVLKPKYMTHELKTDPDVFDAVFDGKKTFEIRKNDRNFKVGDTLRLRRTESDGIQMAQGVPLRYTGSEVRCRISHLLKGPIYGLAEGWVILSIRDLVYTDADGNDRS